MSFSKKSAGKVSGYSSKSASEVLRQFPLHSSLGFRVTPNGCDIIGHFLHESIHPTDVEHIRWVDAAWQKCWDDLLTTVKSDGIPVSRLYDCGSQIEGSLVSKFDDINEALDSDPAHDPTLAKFFLPNKRVWDRLVESVDANLDPQNTILRQDGEWTVGGSHIGARLAEPPVIAWRQDNVPQEPGVEDPRSRDLYEPSFGDEEEDEDGQRDPISPGRNPLEEDGDWHPPDM